MQINRENLTALFSSFDMVFQRGFAIPTSYYEQIASITRSASRQQIYPWLGRTTKFREWLGDRVLQQLEAHDYTIINKSWEDTVAINRDDLDDDNVGIYAPRIEQLGRDAKVHPDKLLFDLIKLAVAAPNDVLAYDKVAFFSTAHPVGSTTQANLDSGGTGPYWFLIDAQQAIRPFIFQSRRDYTPVSMQDLTDEAVFQKKEFRYGVDARNNVGVGFWQFAYASNKALTIENYAAAIAAMKTVKTDAGEPFEAFSGPAASKFLLAPPALEMDARIIINNSLITGPPEAGAGAPGAQSNPWQGSSSLIVAPRLAA